MFRILGHSMKFLRSWTLLPFIAFLVAAPAAAQQASPRSNSPEPLAAVPAAPADAPVIYVSDFDLDVVPRKPSAKPKSRATRTSPPSKQESVSRSSSGVPRTGPSPAPQPATSQSTESADAADEETPADQANTLVRAVSENIIRALTEAGFDARRLDANAPLPKAGVRIRGVFAEADEMNRVRRLLVGGEATGGNLILYVGVNNLQSPEQPLYVLADPPANDPRHGPVITVTSYAPAARYELSRDPSGEELQKISKRIAADLSALVSANGLTLAQ
jgi:Domain of unknown function (DUF4410)